MPSDIGPRKKTPRAYSKTDNKRWGSDYDRDPLGSDTPLIMQSLPPRERTALIKKLIATGAGDGSIAVKINKMGIECSRSDVYMVRNGVRPPNGQGTLEEHFIG